MGKPSGKIEVTEYYMSIHFGLVLYTPFIKLLGIKVDDKVAWEGSNTGGGFISIEKPDLFGGPKKEGGMVGAVTFGPGDDAQVLGAQQARQMFPGRAAEDCPGFRGFASCFFGGPGIENGGRDGFLWSTNNPVIAQTVWFKLECPPTEAIAPDFNTLTNAGGVQANFAHILYEILTDEDWGMGAPLSSIDTVSFEYAAELLHDEGLVGSMMWREKTTIETCAAEIIDVTRGVLYVSPRTGKFTYKLLRDDYDPESLPVFDNTNSRLTASSRKYLGETVGQMTTSWTNPETEKEETVTYQNLANIAQQGQVVADTRNFYPLRDKGIASLVCQRELTEASAPLLSATLETNRTAWDIAPGDCLILNYPRKKINFDVMRVMKVDYGKIGAGKVVLSLIQDIFSLRKPPIVEAPGTQWVDPKSEPAAANAEFVWNLPYYFMANTNAISIATELAYPEVLAAFLAWRSDADTIGFEAMTDVTIANGDDVLTSAGIKTPLGRTLAASAFTAQASSTLPGPIVPVSGEGPELGAFVMFGNGEDDDSELALVTATDGTDWTLTRGVLDTVPQAWPENTPIWFLPVGVRIADEANIRSVGETPQYKLLTRTSLGLLAEDDASFISTTMTARPYAPLRPAGVTVNGTGFGSVALAGADITVAWKTRNRFFEDPQVLAWGDDSVPPEYKQRTVIIVYNVSGGAELVRYNHLWTEESFVIDRDWLAAYSSVRVEVTSERDGLYAIQAHSIIVTGLANDGVTAIPAPPAAGTPPPPIAAPGGAAFAASGTVETNVDGVSRPALVVTGTQDVANMDGLLIRYKQDSSSDWRIHPVVLLENKAIRVSIADVVGETLYDVEVAYVDGNVASLFTALTSVTTGAATITVDGVDGLADDLSGLQDQIDAIGGATSRAIGSSSREGPVTVSGTSWQTIATYAETGIPAGASVNFLDSAVFSTASVGADATGSMPVEVRITEEPTSGGSVVDLATISGTIDSVSLDPGDTVLTLSPAPLSLIELTYDGAVTYKLQIRRLSGMASATNIRGILSGHVVTA